MLSFQGGIRVATYTASKHGVLGITRLLANEWAAKGINVNAIAPGYIETNNTEALRADPDRSRRDPRAHPGGRWGAPSDIGDAAVFLLAPPPTICMARSCRWMAAGWRESNAHDRATGFSPRRRPVMDAGADGNRRRVLIHTPELMQVEFGFDKGAVGALHSPPPRAGQLCGRRPFEVTIDGRTETSGGR